MASSAQSVNFNEPDEHDLERLVSRNEIGERLCRALNLHVGRGRRYSVEELSLGSGVPKRAIRAALAPVNDENYRPLTLENLASIGKFLGASFVSAYLELSGLGAFELMDGQEPLPRVLTSSPPGETIAQERGRIIRRLAELERL